MSRDFDVRYEITTQFQDPLPFVESLKANGYLYQSQDPETSFEEIDGAKVLIIEGLAALCGGESEEEAHKEITSIVKQLDPKAKVGTKWHYCAAWDWDYEFGDEDNENEVGSAQ